MAAEEESATAESASGDALLEHVPHFAMGMVTIRKVRQVRAELEETAQTALEEATASGGSFRFRQRAGGMARPNVVRPVRTGPVPDVCAACSGCVLCRGPREEAARRGAEALAAQAEAAGAGPRSGPRGAARAEADGVEGAPRSAARDPILHGSTVALRAANGGWLAPSKASEAVRLVFGRRPPLSAIFTFSEVGKNTTALTGKVKYSEGQWLRAEDGRLLGAGPRCGADGKMYIALLMLAPSPATVHTAKWTIRRATAALGGEPGAARETLSHADRVVLEQDEYMLACNAKYRHASVLPGGAKPVSQAPHLRRIVNSLEARGARDELSPEDVCVRAALRRWGGCCELARLTPPRPAGGRYTGAWW